MSSKLNASFCAERSRANHRPPSPRRTATPTRRRTDAMVHGHLQSPDTYSHLLTHPVWNEAFTWLKQMLVEPAKGIHPLRGDDMYVNVMSYATLPRAACRFESHRKYLDLQYTMQGGEVIEWRRAPELTADGEYDEGHDVQFYHLAPATTRLHMLPGYFVIFHPSDAHLPKVSDEASSDVFKLVIKIKVNLLSRT